MKYDVSLVPTFFKTLQPLQHQELKPDMQTFLIYHRLFLCLLLEKGVYLEMLTFNILCVSVDLTPQC